MNSYKVGFIDPQQTHDCAGAVKRHVEAIISDHHYIDLVYDEGCESDDALMETAYKFTRLPVQMAILFHMSRQIGSRIRSMLFPIPVIAVDSPLPMTTYFGGSDKRSGELIGSTVVDWIKSNWYGQLDRLVLLTDTHLSSSYQERIDHTMRQVRSRMPMMPGEMIQLNTSSDRDDVVEQVRDVLCTMRPDDRAAFIGYDAETTMGLVDALRGVYQQDHVTVFGHAMDERVREELERPNTPLIASTTYYPEHYGEQLVELVLRQLSGERIPSKTYVDVDLSLARHVH